MWQTIGSSLGTVAASSRTETRREVRSCGWRWTSRSRSCGNKARGATSSPHAPSSRSGARSRWDTHCLGDVFAISMGLPRWPQNRDPCCDPSAAELTSCTLGPVQTLYESLNRFISLGGNRPQFCLGHERVTCLRQYHRGCNMKRVRVDERQGITLFTFYNWA